MYVIDSESFPSKFRGSTLLNTVGFTLETGSTTVWGDSQ